MSAVVDPSPVNERGVDRSPDNTCHCGPQSFYGFDKRDPLTWIGSPTRTSFGLSLLSDCGMATRRELIGRYLVFYLKFLQLHSDRHADSMVDCWGEGEC